MTVSLELADLQGLVVRGYGGLRAACFLLLRVDDSAAGTALAQLVRQVTSGSSTPAASAVNIAFSWEGLRRLGLPGEALAGFPLEFISGMTDPARSRFLGDVDTSAPAGWSWGGPSTPRVDALLLIYGRDQQVLQQVLDGIRGSLTGITEVAQLSAAELPAKGSDGFSEPFGFRDNISQPLIEGLPKAASGGGDVVRAGEFILGYPNEYSLLTDRPILPAALDPAGQLPRDPGNPGQADLGRNGSYLVLRQLAQDVASFWRYLEEATRAADGSSDPARSAALGAKMVGRWPSGAPVVLTPDHDEPALVGDNDFGYHHTDPVGLACPLGAHIRRANPRDSLDPHPGTARSRAVNHRHRIVRRSRSYDASSNGAPGERGLYFMCLNGNLTRQFEFVQHTWLNNPNFNGLRDDDDPLVGPRHSRGATFTQPALPVRERLVGLPRFVDVRGGGYFFLPGLRALRYLASLGSRDLETGV